jgi:integrase
MSMNLTATRVAQLKYDPEGSRIQRLWDARSQGLGIEVFQSGRKSWVFRYRFSGKQKLITLARVDDLNLESAREKAHALRAQLHDGVDPKSVREQRRQADSVRDLFEQYITTPYFKSRSVDFRNNFPSAMRAHILPVIGDQKPDTVKRRQIRDIIDDLIVRKKEGAAKGVLTHTRILFAYAIEQELLENSPADHIKPRYTKSGKRDKWLTADELKKAWFLDAPVQVRALVRWSLLTGCRRDEARCSLRNSVDLDSGVWTVEDTKNHRDLCLPVMPMMISVLDEMRSTYPKSDKLFPATTDWHKEIPRGTLDYIIGVATQREWSMHVLRHTVETHLAELGVAEEVRDMILNHHRKSMGSRYNHSAQLDMKREGLSKWHEYLGSLVDSQG